MTQPETPTDTAALKRPPVAALLPLKLLETVRDHDRPAEVLEDEDLSVSLPRRLGLSGVVDTQIRRYVEAARLGRDIPAEEFRSLLRLILRRPDAETILFATGRQVAQLHFERRRHLLLGLLRRLPGDRLVDGVARRGARRLLRSLLAAVRVETSRQPARLRVTGALTAGVDEDGSACALYTGAIRETLERYRGRVPHVEHTTCSSRGAGFCEWSLE